MTILTGDLLAKHGYTPDHDGAALDPKATLDGSTGDDRSGRVSGSWSRESGFNCCAAAGTGFHIMMGLSGSLGLVEMVVNVRSLLEQDLSAIQRTNGRDGYVADALDTLVEGLQNRTSFPMPFLRRLVALFPNIVMCHASLGAEPSRQPDVALKRHRGYYHRKTLMLSAWW
ncbi:hypothetical protein BP6252_09595 [Coleophoma cylindrospora]|uniref:Uncharacterized protein n=1 Tax=Coleophoma cylindrospora TaxID=1849047 RepID=A0A3D8QWA7_9HELO|nr:hypothetical protein BP6252_09595 [Coleophoma cylindrospora]